MAAEPTLPLAFGLGVASFVSPCVLPLVPGYVSFMSGVGAGEEKETRLARTGAMTFAFVVGFTLIFVALGATATLLGSLLQDNQKLLTRVGGAFIIFMGLVFMGVLKVPFLYREARFHPTPRAGVGGSLLLGATFAFGWSPCIGATMGVAFAMAAGQGGVGGPGEGAILLAAYSLGLGIPFVAVGLGLSYATGVIGWVRRHIRAVNLASGSIMVLIGILFLTNQVFRIAIWMQEGMFKLGLDFWAV